MKTMRIQKTITKDWQCFWAWPSLYATRNGKEYALLLAWGWWVLILHDWKE
jgi:hypothetical protein